VWFRSVHAKAQLVGATAKSQLCTDILMEEHPDDHETGDDRSHSDTGVISISELCSQPPGPNSTEARASRVLEPDMNPLRGICYRHPAPRKVERESIGSRSLGLIPDRFRASEAVQMHRRDGAIGIDEGIVDVECGVAAEGNLLTAGFAVT
jgi:hypothetical protein